MVIELSDLKSTRSASSIEITSLISDQNCTTRSSITTLLQPFWNRRIQSVPNFIDRVACLLKSGNKKAFKFHFVFETDMTIELKWCGLEQKWRDLEQMGFWTKNDVIRE